MYRPAQRRASPASVTSAVRTAALAPASILSRGDMASPGTCGSHILGYSGAMPQNAFLKAALFDVAPALAIDVWMENAYGG
jgi:hypothetical protein